MNPLVHLRWSIPIAVRYVVRRCLVNEAIIDVGIGMAKFRNEYHAGFMPNDWMSRM